MWGVFMKIKFSDIHVGAFVWFNENYACKINKHTLFYRENGQDQIKEFAEDQEIEIGDDHE